MLSVEEAESRILAAIQPLDTQAVPLGEALGLALQEDLVAPEDHPRFDNSAMDGFAVRVGDPQPLRIVGEVSAGAPPSFSMQPGEAARINTGAVLPAGAEAVVMVEQCRVEGDSLYYEGTARSGDHFRRRGEHLRAGQVAVPRATRVTPAVVAMAAFLGYPSLRCTRRPVIAILSTGDELVEPGQPLAPGQIYNSNAYALEACLRDLGCLPLRLPVARDEQAEISASLRDLEADAIVTSAGVSMGQKDFVLAALGDLGVEMAFWKVKMRPGKPLGFGMWGAKPVFALPGNPVSSMVTFEVFCRRALGKLMGLELKAPVVEAPLLEAIEKKAGLKMFYRCRFDGSGVRTTGRQDSHLLLSMVEAAGLLELPEERTSFAVGETVRVRLLPGSAS